MKKRRMNARMKEENWKTVKKQLKSCRGIKWKQQYVLLRGGSVEDDHGGAPAIEALDYKLVKYTQKSVSVVEILLHL